MARKRMGGMKGGRKGGKGGVVSTFAPPMGKGAAGRGKKRGGRK